MLHLQATSIGRRLTLQEGLHDIKAILQAERNHAHSRSDRVAAANPVPEAKSILGVNAEGLDQLEVGTHSHHVLSCGVRTELSSQPRPAGHQDLVELKSDWMLQLAVANR